MTDDDPPVGGDSVSEFAAWRRVDPRTLGLVAAPALLFALVYVAVTASATSITVDSAIELLIPLLAFGAAVVRYITGTYAVDDGAVRWRSGLFVRQSTQIGAERIQDVEVTRPLLARVVGLSAVTVSSAGGAGEIRLSYLDRAVAERLCRHVQDLHDRALGAALVPSGADPGTPPPLPHEPPLVLHRVDNGELARWVAFRAWPLGVVMFAAAVGIVVAGLDLVWFAVLPALPLSALSISKPIVDRVHLTVVVDGDALRTSEGLTTVRRASTRMDRVQLVMASSWWLQRWRGSERVRFASADVTTNQNEGAVREELALDVTAGSWHRMASAIARRPVADASSLRTKPRVAADATLRRWGLAGAASASATAVVGWLAAAAANRPLWVPLVFAVGVLLSALVGGSVRGRLRLGAEGWLVTPDDLVVRDGVVRRRTLVVFAEKTQAVQVRSGPLQRRLGLVTVSVDLAPPGRSTLAVVADISTEDAATLVASLTRSASRELPGGV